MATTYRLCGPTDLDRFTGLVVECLRADGRSPDPATVRRVLRRFLGDTRLGHGWIIERGGTPAGYTMLGFSDPGRSIEPRAYVTALYVTPEQRGQGIGARTERFLGEVGAWLRMSVHCFDTAKEAKHATLLLRHDPKRVYQSTHHPNQAVA